MEGKMEGRSSMLSKSKKISIEKEEDAKKLEAFMKRRKANRDEEMASLRAERRKLNGMSTSGSGK